MGAAPDHRRDHHYHPRAARLDHAEPDNHVFVDSIRGVCAGEAHLLSAPRRGSTLEMVLTSLRALTDSPRIMLISGTLGGLERLQAWLQPCEVFVSTHREPPLQLSVLDTEGEDANEVVVREAADVLADPGASLLVFTYRGPKAKARGR